MPGVRLERTPTPAEFECFYCAEAKETIANCLQEVAGWRTGFAPDAPTLLNRPIDTSRLTAEFGATDSDLAADLPTLLALEQECQCSPSMKHMAA